MVAHDVNPILSHLDTVVYLAPGGSRIGPPREVITGAALTELFGTPIEVLTASDGRLVVIGQPEQCAVHPDQHAGRQPMTLAADPSWNPIIDLQQMWSFPFMVNAFRAGTIVAVLAGVMGWFMVLRRQTFAGHTLSLVGFPGAAGAVLVGVAASYGYLAFCVAGALVIAALPRARPGGYSEESAVIGTVQSFALACGFLFVALYKGFLNGVNALLFGNFLGITTGQVSSCASSPQRPSRFWE